MTEKEIAILMVLHEVTQTRIAKELGITVPAVNSVIKGLRKNPRIRQAIADALGCTFQQIWSDDNRQSVMDKTLKQNITKKESMQGKNSGIGE